MFHNTVFKWLTIIIVVLFAFLLMLLGLGYLLKENEKTTTALKAKLEQQAIQNNQPKSMLSYQLLSAVDKSKQQIINDNLTCQSNKQCMLIQTNSLTLGCLIAINTTGAAILLKVGSSENRSYQLSTSSCEQQYLVNRKLLAQCKNNLCMF